MGSLALAGSGELTATTVELHKTLQFSLFASP